MRAFPIGTDAAVSHGDIADSRTTTRKWSHILARIERMHMEYVAGEDRIRLRVRTGDPAEVRCWLTRRFTRHLWQALEKAMADDPDLATAATAEERSTRLARKHTEANARSPARADDEAAADRGENPAELPLGEEPILLTRVRVRRTDRGHKLSLLPTDDHAQGLHIDMDETLLHRVTALLAKAVARTDWDLELEPPNLVTTLTELQAGERIH